MDWLQINSYTKQEPVAEQTAVNDDDEWSDSSISDEGGEEVSNMRNEKHHSHSRDREERNSKKRKKSKKHRSKEHKHKSHKHRSRYHSHQHSRLILVPPFSCVFVFFFLVFYQLHQPF
jgi:Fe2+ transport system protein B